MSRLVLIVSAVLIAALSIAWRVDRSRYGEERYKEGKSEVQSAWDAAVVQATREADEEEDRRRKHNDEVLKAHETELAAVDGRADDLERRLRVALNRHCASSVPESGGQPAVPVAGTEHGSERSSLRVDELVAAVKRYDKACQVLIEQRDATIQQLIPQL